MEIAFPWYVFVVGSQLSPDRQLELIESRICLATSEFEENHVEIVVLRSNQSNAAGKLGGLKNESSKSLTHIVKFLDNRTRKTVVCIVPPGGSSTSIIVGNEDLEKVLLSTSNLVVRSTWKYNGKCFILGRCKISVGVMSRGQHAKVVLEINAGSVEDHEKSWSAELIRRQVNELAESVVPENLELARLFTTTSNYISLDGSNGEDTSSNSGYENLIDRAHQWVNLVY